MTAYKDKDLCAIYLSIVSRNNLHLCSSSSAPNMEPSTIAAVEKILKYRFKNKSHLEQALTHSSCRENVSYERLELLGDAALGLVVVIHFFCLDQKLDPGQLTDLRKDSVSNEKLARVAAVLGLHQFVKTKNTEPLNLNVEKYVKAVKQVEDQNITVKNPDILADIVESLAGAVFLDLDFDLKELQRIFKDILSVDEIMLPVNEADGSSEINGAQHKLYGLCGKNKWKNLDYSEDKAEGHGHEWKYVYSVKIEIGDIVRSKKGDEKSNKKDAKNSAAYRLLCSLQASGIII